MTQKWLVLIVCALAAAACDGGSQSPSSSEVGRWAIVHSPHVERDTILLDTATGDSWGLVLLGDGQDSPYAWQYIGKVGGPGGQHSVPQQTPASEQGSGSDTEPTNEGSETNPAPADQPEANSST